MTSVFRGPIRPGADMWSADVYSPGTVSWCQVQVFTPQKCFQLTDGGRTGQKSHRSSVRSPTEQIFSPCDRKTENMKVIEFKDSQEHAWKTDEFDSLRSDVNICVDKSKQCLLPR